MDNASIRDSYDAVADVYAQDFTADLTSKPLDRAMLTAFSTAFFTSTMFGSQTVSNDGILSDSLSRSAWATILP